MDAVSQITPQDEARFRNRVSGISILCSILVVFLHAYAFGDLVETTFAYHLEHLISRSIAQSAVPVFFAMSAFLFYRNFDWGKLLPKLRSRFFSLVVPFLIWNGIYTLFFFIIARFPFIHTEPFSLTPGNLLQGIVFYRYNLGFWFVYQLILLTYLCPLVYLLLNKKLVALVTMAVMLLLYGLDFKTLGPVEVRSVLYYMIGGYCAVHHRDTVVRHRGCGWGGILAFLGAELLIYTGLDKLSWFYLVTRVLMIIAVYQFSGLLGDVPFPKWLYCSFPIYAMHSLFLETLNKVFSFFLSMGSNWILIDYFVSTGITLAVIIGFNAFLLRYIPKLHHILFGGRVR